VVRNERAMWLGVPFISQLDGTLYGGVNCGPASTAMVLGAFGIRTSPAAVRNYVNDVSGNYSADAGTSLDHLGRAVRESGLDVSNLHKPGGGYLRWSTDLVRQQIEDGRPVVTLVKYRALPSHSGSLSDFDHYIVIAGLAGNDFIYNDAAFGGERGFGLLISPGDLERAWDYSSIPRHGMAVGLTAESLAGRKARIESAPGDPLLDLGQEVSDEMLLEGVEAELGDEVPAGDYNALTWGRVEIDAQPGAGEAPTAQPTTAAGGAPSGLEMGGFVGGEGSRPMPGTLGQSRPIQGVGGTVVEPGAEVPLPLLGLGLALVVGIGLITSRRLLEQ
jgi:hypothetical protein